MEGNVTVNTEHTNPNFNKAGTFGLVSSARLQGVVVPARQVLIGLNLNPPALDFVCACWADLRTGVALGVLEVTDQFLLLGVHPDSGRPVAVGMQSG